jgi:hypothetical protein
MNSSKEVEFQIFTHVVYLAIKGADLVIPFISKPDADFYINGLLAVAKKKHFDFMAQLYSDDGLVDTVIYPPKTLN